MVVDGGRTEVEVAGDEAAQGVSRLELQLPRTAQSARRARRTIAAFLDPTDVPGAVVDDLLLLVSELVTNAVVHAGSPPVVSLDADEQRIKVAVADRDPGSRPSIGAPGPGATSGRGVLLVDRLSARWGVEPQSSGKVVWFELPRDR
ncbi:MAG: ATP-binding protein [Acidimicrobiales bacterium]